METKTVMRAMASVLFALVLGGCATSSRINDQGQSNAPGQAAYSVDRTLPGGGTCKVWITSGREVEEGNIAVDKDCAVTAEAKSLSGKEAQQMMMELLGALLQRLPVP